MIKRAYATGLRLEPDKELVIFGSMLENNWYALDRRLWNYLTDRLFEDKPLLRVTIANEIYYRYGQKF